MRRLLYVLSFALLFASPSLGQILVPDQVKPYTPIVARCDCIIPKNGTVELSWRTDSKSEVIEVADARGLENLHIWAAPGEHWLEVTVVTQYFREITVWVPDPEAPDDVTKAKKEVLKLTERYDIQRFDKTYKVLNPGPGPSPGPDPDPDPDPTPGPAPTGFAAKIVAWAKAEKVGASDVDLIGDNFLSVGSQGGDPARSTGWDLSAFVAKTKELHLANLGVDKLGGYRTFLENISKEQFELATARGITARDKEKIAALWTETGEALKKAAGSVPGQTYYPRR